VLILSGSNDCIAQETEDLQQYYRWWFWLSQHCSQQYALDNMKQMVQMVQEEAPKAKVSAAAACSCCIAVLCWHW
jgi:phage terminase large subunit GpA-like protein